MGEITYRIDEEREIIFSRCVGKITLDDLINHVNTIIFDPKFRRGMNSISDISDCELEGSFSILSSFLEHLKKMENLRGKFKWAVIVNVQKRLDGIQLFKTLANEGKFLVKLFEDKDEAEKWINS